MDFTRLTQKQVASAVGTSDRTVRTWTKTGMPRNEDNTYSLPKVIEWLLTDHRDDSLCQASTTPGGEDWLALYRRERFLLTKLEREQVEGSLIPKEQISTAWCARMVEYSNGLEHLRYRLPPLLEGKNQADMTQAIEREVWAIRDRIFRVGRFCPTTEEEIRPCSACPCPRGPRGQEADTYHGAEHGEQKGPTDDDA